MACSRFSNTEGFLLKDLRKCNKEFLTCNRNGKDRDENPMKFFLELTAVVDSDFSSGTPCQHSVKYSEKYGPLRAKSAHLFCTKIRYILIDLSNHLMTDL